MTRRTGCWAYGWAQAVFGPGTLLVVGLRSSKQPLVFQGQRKPALRGARLARSLPGMYGAKFLRYNVQIGLDI